MKIFKRLYLFLIILILFNSIDCFASTKTYTRSEDNYLVESDIHVTSENRWNVLNTPAVDASEKIYDFADLFTSLEEEQLYEKVNIFIEKYSLDLAVVTIDNNVKNSTLEYADDFYDYNSFLYDGLVLLIDMDNREVAISTSGSAIPLYNDYRINLILDNIYEKLSDGNYYEGSLKCINLVGEFAEIGVAVGQEDFSVTSSGGVTKNLYIPQILLFAFIGTTIIILIMIFSNKMVKKASSSRNYLNKDTMRIIGISETFLGSSVSKTAIVNTSSSGSSSGGSSSIRTSSSGRSHGGGSRKF